MKIKLAKQVPKVLVPTLKKYSFQFKPGDWLMMTRDNNFTYLRFLQIVDVVELQTDLQLLPAYIVDLYTSNRKYYKTSSQKSQIWVERNFKLMSPAETVLYGPKILS